MLVSGTNGKTTTTRMLARIASDVGFRPIHNRAGANLLEGIVAAMAERTDLLGHPDGDLGLFEVDEATVPALVAATHPRLLAILNLFRDQLDRYGEVETVAQTWRAAIATLPPDATLVLNADDPIVAHLGAEAPCRVVNFGVDVPALARSGVPHDADRRLCPQCGHRFVYARTHYGHLGHYRCSSCGWARPTPEVTIVDAAHAADRSVTYTVRAGSETLSLAVRLQGLYNAYNALAATTIAWSLGIPAPALAPALAGTVGAFGRGEEISIGSGSILLALVKNPVGFNEVLRTHLPDPHPTPSALPPTPTVLIAINDRFADGTDISWLWDVDFELLAGRASRTIASGLRAEDVALRLKYALVEPTTIETIPAIPNAVDRMLQCASGGTHVLALCSYTAMLEMRAQLQRRGHVSPFWED